MSEGEADPVFVLRRAVLDASNELKFVAFEASEARRAARALRCETEQLLANIAEHGPQNRIWLFDYPEIPKPMAVLGISGDGLPEKSGVYFIFSGNAVVYVGQSVIISMRCRLGKSHQKIRPGDSIAWLLVPSEKLYFTEAFYIGLLRPIRNQTKLNP